MFKLFDFILHGCWHKWKILETCTVNENKVPIGTAYMCQCERCGRVHRFNCY